MSLIALEKVFGILKSLGETGVKLWKSVAPKTGSLLLKFLNRKDGEPLGLEELRISLVAPSGFGKTTLLSTVMGEINRNITPTDMQGSYTLEVDATDDEDKARIDKNNEIIDNTITSGSLKVKTGISGTGDINTFNFNISLTDRTNNKVIQPFCILDAPGGLIAKDIKGDLTEWREHLRNSRILWMPINSAAMMEASSKVELERVGRSEKLKIHEMKSWAEEWAKYQKVKKLPACIFYIPVKCEKYLSKGNKESAEKLKATFIDLYGGIIKSIKEISPKKIEQYYVPVETIGAVKLSNSEWCGTVEEIEKIEFEENYVVDDRNGKFREIKNADLLLKKIYEYAHDEILNKAEEDKQALEGMKNPLNITKKLDFKKSIQMIEESLKPIIDELDKYSKTSLSKYKL